MIEPDDHHETVWHFDSEVGDRSAWEFWLSLDEENQSTELLFDLLLVQIEKSETPIDELNVTLHRLREVCTDTDRLCRFAADGYRQLIELGLKPQWSDFDEQNRLHVQSLQYNGEPIGLGELVADRFLIEQRLGAGSFGIVFRAADTKDDIDVALKIPRTLSGDHQNRIFEMLSSEAIVADLIQTSTASQRVELLIDRGMPILVMPYIDGPTLRELINQGPLPAQEAVRIMTEVFAVLDRAHQQKVLHRDVKPENILLSSSGDVFLTDFGLVLFEDDDQLERAGEVAGTRGYLPPDALLGDTHLLDGRVDVWAGGMVLYECLTGHRFDAGGSRESALVSAIVSAKMVPKFSADLEISAELQRTCQRCLEPNPLHRYASSRDVVEALMRVNGQIREEIAHPFSLYAWRFGLLFGKYSRSRSYFTAFAGDTTPESVGLAVVQAFGLQENLYDIRRAFTAFWEDGNSPATSLIATELPVYPMHATAEIRMCLYEDTHDDANELVSESVQRMDGWLEAVFDFLQAIFEGTAESVHALFEFGYLAEQAIGAFGARKNLSSVASRSGLPSDIWLDYCEQIQHPEDHEQKQLEKLCQQLTKQVERFLLFGPA